jgi:hypothetical protein
VAPFHPLRQETRALAARALAAFALFCALAIALLGGPGQLAHAEADKDKGATGGNGEAVLQAVDVPKPQGNGNGNAFGQGGSGKSDPADPVDPTSPPTNTAPSPSSDPSSAPTDDGSSGKGNGSGDPSVTGAGGKGDTADPDPKSNNGKPHQELPTATPSTTTETPVLAQPSAVSLGSERRTAQSNRIRFRRDTTRRATGPGLVAGVGGTQARFEPAPAAAAPAFEKVGKAEGGGDGSANPSDRPARPNEAKGTKTGPPIIRAVPHFVEEVPAAL